MPKNRNALIKHLIGHLSTTVTHRILQGAVTDENVRAYYGKEAAHALEKAIAYRREINPPDVPLSPEEADRIRQRVAQNVRNELEQRKARGYTGLDFSGIAPATESLFAEIGIR